MAKRIDCHQPGMVNDSPIAGDVGSPTGRIQCIKPIGNGGNMEKLLEMWLNPINLGILFLCVSAGIWLLAHSGPTHKEK
jgi:hypothetical protein